MTTIKDVILYSSEQLKGHINFGEYQNNILGLIFYKYLSDKIIKENNKQLFKYNITYTEAFKNENKKYYAEKVKQNSLEIQGYFIKPENLYPEIIKHEKITSHMTKALKEIQFKDQTLTDIYSNVNLETDDENLQEILEKIIKKINTITFTKENKIQSLIKYFMKEGYTPIEVSTLLAKLVTIQQKEYPNIYDSTAGSASTLIILDRYAKTRHIYGQELNKSRYNLARINMMIEDVPTDKFSIYNEDTTTTRHKLPKMNAIVSHLPFFPHWNYSENLLKDERYNKLDQLPPKTRADYIYIINNLYQLDNNGTMAIVLPQGALFRQSKEKNIRKTLIKKYNYIDTIISLPDKIFNKNMKTCIIIFKKNRKSEDTILFIDPTTTSDKLDNKTINKILETYKNRQELENYSHNASLDEIRKNNYNLNIPRYVDTYTPKKEINIEDTLKEIRKINEKIEKLDKKYNKLLKEI